MKLKFQYGAVALLIATINCISVSMAQQPCRISKMTTPQEMEYYFRYDTSGGLQTITAPAEGRVDSFFYYKDSMVIITDLNNMRDSKIIYSFNKDRQVIHQKFLPVGYEGWIEDIDYGYKDGRLTTVKRAVRVHNEPPEKAIISMETFIWKNGNPVKIINAQNGKPDGSIMMQYYTDKPFRIGDHQSYEQIMTGISVLNPSDLLKSITGMENLKLSYEFDEQGNIISMTEEEENDTRVTKYEYECK